MFIISSLFSWFIFIAFDELKVVFCAKYSYSALL